MMFKLKKYLKPYLVGLILAIVLLFGQAFSDLNLPNYMSNIVNVGIQQNGVEHAAPKVISENGLTLITSFMTDDEQEAVKSSYTLTNTADYSGLSLDTVEKSVYVLNSDVDYERVDGAFGQATLTMMSFLKTQNMGGGSNQESMNLDTLDITKLYGMIPMVSRLENADILALREANATDDLVIKQGSVVISQAYLSELGVNLTSVQTSYIVSVGLKMLGVALLGGLATVLVSLLSSRISAAVARDLRKDVFDKIEQFSNKEFDQFSTASLITRTTNDISQIQMLVGMGIRMICYAPIMAIGGTVMALNKSMSMAWIIVLACVVLIGLIMVIIAMVMPRFKRIQKLVDRLNLVSRENLGGLMVIRAFATQEHEKGRFEEVNESLTKTTRFVNRVMNMMMPAMSLVMNSVSLLIVWVGAHQIAQSSMQIGDMMAFIQYSMQIISSFLMISMMFIFVPRAAVSAERIVEVLDTEVSIVDPKNPKKFKNGKEGLIKFDNVSFKFSDSSEYTLQNISFEAKPGETTAIIGPTGSGKSTIANLILRFYDVSEGQISIDGVDVRDMTQHDLREMIGYVPQKGVLLSGTIDSNLRYGAQDASEETIHASARVAQAMSFIEAKEDGFDSLIAQGGTNVSGGQKQRLSIARALAKNPEVFIFDDSFSALDFKTDAILRKELKEHTGNSTMIIVAQRVNTIMNAEQIIVLNNGVIVGKGTHRELLETCPEYYDIASSQLSKEELA